MSPNSKNTFSYAITVSQRTIENHWEKDSVLSAPTKTYLSTVSCKMFLKIFSKFLFSVFKNIHFIFYFAAAADARVNSILKRENMKVYLSRKKTDE